MYQYSHLANALIAKNMQSVQEYINIILDISHEDLLRFFVEFYCSYALSHNLSLLSAFVKQIEQICQKTKSKKN